MCNDGRSAEAGEGSWEALRGKTLGGDGIIKELGER